MTQSELTLLMLRCQVEMAQQAVDHAREQVKLREAQHRTLIAALVTHRRAVAHAEAKDGAEAKDSIEAGAVAGTADGAAGGTEDGAADGASPKRVPCGTHDARIFEALAQGPCTRQELQYLHIPQASFIHTVRRLERMGAIVIDRANARQYVYSRAAGAEGTAADAIPVRFDARILAHLKQTGGASIDALVAALGLRKPQIYPPLRALLNSGKVKVRAEGRHGVYYVP